jgi:hypothetical protein
MISLSSSQLVSGLEDVRSLRLISHRSNSSSTYPRHDPFERFMVQWCSGSDQRPRKPVLQSSGLSLALMDHGSCVVMVLPIVCFGRLASASIAHEKESNPIKYRVMPTSRGGPII